MLSTNDYKQADGKRDLRASRSRARKDDLGHGDVAIAAITSCTNTSNPSGAHRRGPSRP
jgi:aconitase A